MAAHATHHATQVRNLGVPGWTTSDLVSALRPGGNVARRLPGADIVTITIGANDMSRARNEWAHDECVDCFARVAASVRTNVAEIIRLVRARVGTRPLEVLVTTYWNVFKEPPAAGRDDPDGPGYVEMAELATSRANHAICAAAKQRHAACVDLYRPFKGAHGGRDATGLLAPDRDHPDAAGHQLIASTLAAYGWRELGLPVVQHRS
jgi:lysophospholipase L1-like esterase